MLTPTPTWPPGTGPRIFAYIKPFAAIRQIVSLLAFRGHPTIMVLDGVNKAELVHCSAPNILMFDRPIRHVELLDEFQLAITHAGHGMTCQLLLAQVPQFVIPLTLEQTVTSERLVSLGAAQQGSAKDASSIVNQLNTLMKSPADLTGVFSFSKKYRQLAPLAIDNIYHRLMSLF